MQGYTQSTFSLSIYDAQDAPLQEVLLILKDKNEKVTQTLFTNERGQFDIPISHKGYSVIIKKMGYIEVEYLLKDLIIRNIRKVVLEESVNELEEVVVQAQRPILVKSDTVVFYADTYKQGNEQVVEDLLKKIPGLQIDANGIIKVGNQEIAKVMIDGDDMFENGYKLLTKNMPVNPIHKIEIYQNYSSNKHLKGIENSSQVALNLSLKEEAKHIWFGNLSAGRGLTSENRYEARGNLMNFSKKNKYYFLTNLNNIGQDASGDINHLIRPTRSDEASSIGDDQSVHTLLSLDFETPNLKSKRVRLNKTEMLSLNSIFTLSDKTKLKALGFLNADKLDFFRNSLQQFTLGNTSFTNTENFIGRQQQLTGFGKLDLTHDLTPKKTLEYTGKFNKTSEENQSDLLFNKNEFNERLYADNQLHDQKITFTNRLKEQTVVVFTGRYIHEKTPQNYTINPFIFKDLFAENADNTQQFSENKMQFAGFEAHLLDKKKGGDLLEIELGSQSRRDRLNTDFELLDNQEYTIVAPDGYQNRLTYTTNDLYVSAKYRFKRKNFLVLTQADAHQLFNQLDNGGISSVQTPFFILPKIGLDWKVNGENKITTSYTYNTTNAGVLDVYSGFVQTGFRSFSKGLEEFNQLNSSQAILNYTFGSWGDKFFANALFVYSRNNDFYSTNARIVQNFSQAEKIIIKDREFLSVSSHIDRYLTPLKSNLKVNWGATKTNFKNIVNNSDLREIKNVYIESGFEVRSGWRGFFNYHLGSRWMYNQVETTVKNDFMDNLSFIDFSLMFSPKFTVQLQTERYYFGNLEVLSNKYFFVDLESRYVVKENKLTLFLVGNNLLNTKTFKNYRISDINSSQTEFRLMPRYYLLKAEYRF